MCTLLGLNWPRILQVLLFIFLLVMCYTVIIRKHIYMPVRPISQCPCSLGVENKGTGALRANTSMSFWMIATERLSIAHLATMPALRRVSSLCPEQSSC